MFKQGKKPAIKAPASELTNIVAALLRAGYEVHDGMRIKRRRELITLRKRFRRKDGPIQNHVQIVLQPGDEEVCLYAHTEPAIEDLLTHGLVAFMDEVDFANGSRMLKRDIGEFLLTLDRVNANLRGKRVRGPGRKSKR